MYEVEASTVHFLHWPGPNPNGHHRPYESNFDWLVSWSCWRVQVNARDSIHHGTQACTQSLFLTNLLWQVNLIDRCLSKFMMQRSKLQLLGCACMLLASKYEEIYAPAVDEFVYISDNTYTKEQARTVFFVFSGPLSWHDKITDGLGFKHGGENSCEP